MRMRTRHQVVRYNSCDDPVVERIRDFKPLLRTFLSAFIWPSVLLPIRQQRGKKRFHHDLDVAQPTFRGVDHCLCMEARCVGVNLYMIDYPSDYEESFPCSWRQIVGNEWDFNEDGLPIAPNGNTQFHQLLYVVEPNTREVRLKRYSMVLGEFETSMHRTAETAFDAAILGRDSLYDDVSVFSAQDSGQLLHVDLQLRLAGEIWHNERAKLLGFHDSAPQISLLSKASDFPVVPICLLRILASQHGQPIAAPRIYADIEKIYVLWTEYDSADELTYGQVQGSAPVSDFLKFRDGTEIPHHNFKVEQSVFKGSDCWVHMEPRNLDVSPLLIGHEWTLKQRTTDMGTDDLCLQRGWRDYSATRRDLLWVDSWGVVTNVCFDSGNPYDLDEGSYPQTIADSFCHVHSSEGNYMIVLCVRDNERDFDSDFLVVRTIHLPHIGRVDYVCIYRERRFLRPVNLCSSLSEQTPAVHWRFLA